MTPTARTPGGASAGPGPAGRAAPGAPWGAAPRRETALGLALSAALHLAALAAFAMVAPRGEPSGGTGGTLMVTLVGADAAPGTRTETPPPDAPEPVAVTAPALARRAERIGRRAAGAGACPTRPGSASRAGAFRSGAANPAGRCAARGPRPPRDRAGARIRRPRRRRAAPAAGRPSTRRRRACRGACGAAVRGAPDDPRRRNRRRRGRRIGRRREGGDGPWAGRG